MTRRLPPLDVLDPVPADTHAVTTDRELVSRTLAEHGVSVDEVGVRIGPQVITYLVKPGRGVLPAKVAKLADALAVATERVVRYGGVRGGRVIFEVERAERAGVTLRETIEQGRALIRLGFPLGRSTNGGVQHADLATLPHLIVAGTTGSGKSSFLHAMLTTWLLRNTPDDLHLHLVDPKRVELPAYEGAPHVRSLVTDAHEALEVLKSATAMMDARYGRLKAKGLRDLSGWNDRAADDERWAREVVVIEELADLLMSPVAKAIEHELSRIAQLGRAAGVHIVAATQRPDAVTLPRLLRANVPARVVFAPATVSDGQVALGRPGATGLLGQGDGLFAEPGPGDPMRFQAPYVKADEVARVVAWWQRETEPVRPPTTVELLEADTAADAEAEAMRAALRSYTASARRVDPDLVVPLTPEEKLAHLGLDDEELLDHLAMRVLERAADLLDRRKDIP